MSTNNPYESPIDASAFQLVKRGNRVARTLLVFFGLMAAFVFLVALLLPVTRTARGPARRNACINNVKQISLALLNYEAVHGSLPPAYTVDKEGNRLHSWRTLILPYLEEQALYNSIDLTKPWDDPVNEKAAAALVYAYHCPSASHDDGLTTYLAVVDSTSAFRGSVGAKLEDIQGISKQVVVVDVPSNHAVHWMSPEDIKLSSWEKLLSVESEYERNHNSVMVGFADGHTDVVHFDEASDLFSAPVPPQEPLAMSQR